LAARKRFLDPGAASCIGDLHLKRQVGNASTPEWARLLPDSLHAQYKVGITEAGGDARQRPVQFFPELSRDVRLRPEIGREIHIGCAPRAFIDHRHKDSAFEKETAFVSGDAPYSGENNLRSLPL